MVRVRNLSIGDSFKMPISNEPDASGIDKMTWKVIKNGDERVLAVSHTHPDFKVIFHDNEEVVKV